MADNRKNDGGPAFPQPMLYGPTGDIHHAIDWQGMGGISVRDYFAAQAMGQLMRIKLSIEYGELARMAYDIAEVMVWERRSRNG